MNRAALILSFLISISAGAAPSCPAPERPAKVGHRADWVGGCDGGAWIEVTGFSKKQIRLKIHHESGDVWSEGAFSIEGGCQFKSANELRVQLDAYDGEKVLLKPISPENPASVCLLKPRSSPCLRIAGGSPQ